ncbi:recQ-mediated genome instability protein 1-like [Vanessa cardui]|uniref:recQ-mediated genome instability protein 1-like n=1 Tax=Vanessa cardui TaxID=171605 RepID=UPI001F12A3CC|nr:recQ-mediated genome instability protein 1-like [Vanessa cardui]
MSYNYILNSVRSYMSSNHMIVDQEWLSECVNHLIENNFNEDEIKLQTKEQWLLNNLTDVCPGCLPQNLKSRVKIELNGQYVLQINALVDIGSSAYQQHLKLQKVNTENIEATTRFEDKISNHRMIKLYMTDGVQEVTGIEYKPMRNLSLDVIPGSKVLIKGPVECRRGMFLLTENCIELLGGEVEELIVANSQAAILSSKLSLPIPQDFLPIPAPTIDQTRDRTIPSPDIQMIPTTNSHEQIEPMTNFVEDEIDMEQLAVIEAQYSSALTKRRSEDDMANPDKRIKRDPVSSSNNDDYPDDNDMFFEDEEYLKELEAKFDEKENEQFNTDFNNRGDRPESNGINNPMTASSNNTASTSKDRSEPISRSIRPSSEPFVYIKQINDLSELERTGKVFKVKAQILKILSKLTVGKEGWSLSCTIVDGTATIDVDFSSDVLSKLVGFTPQEMIQMKKQMAKNAQIKDAAVSALQKAKDNLQVLYCIIEITILERPLITQLIPFETCHTDLLMKRLKDSGL